MRRTRLLLLTVICGLTVALSGSSASAQLPATAVLTRPPVTKLLVVVVENHSLDQMKVGMPYTFGLAQKYGYATDYHAITHPSLPNYIAIAGGQTYGVRDDKLPAYHRLSGRSVFGQALRNGKTAATYAESMPCAAAATTAATTRRSTTRGPTSSTSARAARRTTAGWPRSPDAAQRTPAAGRHGRPEPLPRRAQLLARHRGRLVQAADVEGAGRARTGSPAGWRSC